MNLFFFYSKKENDNAFFISAHKVWFIWPLLQGCFTVIRSIYCIKCFTWDLLMEFSWKHHFSARHATKEWRTLLWLFYSPSFRALSTLCDTTTRLVCAASRSGTANRPCRTQNTDTMWHDFSTPYITSLNQTKYVSMIAESTCFCIRKLQTWSNVSCHSSIIPSSPSVLRLKFEVTLGLFWVDSCIFHILKLH